MLNFRALLLLLPILFAVGLVWVIRTDRRRNFVQQRLRKLTVRDIGSEPAPSLSRTVRATSLSFLPEYIRVLVDREFEAAGNRVGILHLIVAALIPAVLVIAFVTHVLSFSPVIAILLAMAAATAAPLLLLRMAQARYKRAFLDVFPDALDLVSRGVKAGLPVTEALLVAGREMADPVGHELRHTFSLVQIGMPMIDALQATADRIRVADFQFMVVALSLQEKTGGGLAETLNNLSGVIRARKALRLKARALSAEAKVSGMILAALPFLVGGAMFVMNRDLMRLLFVDSRGRFMVGVAFLSLIAGLMTMTVMVKKAIR